MVKKFIYPCIGEELDFIKEDMGYETQEEFDQDYKTLCPITLVDFVVLSRAITKEIEEIEEYCLKENKPITASHIMESLRIGPLGFFEEALEARRDEFKDSLDLRKKVTAYEKAKTLTRHSKVLTVLDEHYAKKAGA